MFVLRCHCRCSLFARRDDDWLTLTFLLLGLEGTAGSNVSLDDEWIDVGAEAAKATAVTEKIASDFEKTVPQLDSASEEGLSIVVKLCLAGVIFAACFAFIKTCAPRRTGVPGRHGAYEKVGA
jgi:hypothetical protein